ncbi:hypothetical protein FC977_13665 [Clostridium sporogenes]|nr:hypothetical protein [Clostridium sporogenes]
MIGVSSGKILKQRLNEDGYKVVTLGKGELGRTSKTVHRLVALLFIDNPKNYPEVNHKDFDRANNVFTNLEWTTHKENIDYTIKANRHISCDKDKLKGKNNPNYNNHKLSEKYKNNPKLSKENNSRPKEKNGRAVPITMYNSNNIKIKEFKYIGECAEYLIKNNFTKSKVNSIRTNISNSLKNKKTYLGYYFKHI